MAPRLLRWRYTRIGDTIYPFVPVRFARATTRTPTIKALLDSGSDRVLIPMGLALFLDLRLERMSRPLRTIGGVVGGFKARTDLTVGDGPDRLAYRDLTITVIDRMRGPILLGRRPIFRDCVVTFDEGHEMLTLEPGRRVRVRDKVGGEHV